MALADILQMIASQKEEQIRTMKADQELESKQLIENSEKQGTEYSAQRFEEFEKLKHAKELKYDSDISREKRIKFSYFQNTVMDSVFEEVEKELSSLSKEELTALCSRLIRSIPEKSGSIVSKGTDVQILKEAVSSAEKSFEVLDGEGAGGFEFVGDGYTVDFSFHTLVSKDLRSKYEADLFTELFA